MTKKDACAILRIVADALDRRRYQGDLHAPAVYLRELHDELKWGVRTWDEISKAEEDDE